MPFHSTETRDEAESLVVRYCRLGIKSGEYFISRDWPAGDILAAMRSAARQFGLEPSE